LAGELRGQFNGVSVLGGIQPGKLADALLSSTDDGLVARFLFAWPDKAPFRRPTVAADLGLLADVYRRLEELCWAQDAEGKLSPITLPLSPSAADIFEHWQIENAALDDDASNLYKSFVGKMDGTVLRLALVAELSAWAFNGGAEPTQVSADCLIAAAAWVDDYAKHMAQRTYGDAALPAVERNAAVLARYIRKHDLHTINKRALRRSPHKSHLPSLRDAAALDATLAYLVDAGWLRESHSRDGTGPGRQREDYTVNPAVFGSEA
jgi:hypothetical protein